MLTEYSQNRSNGKCCVNNRVNNDLFAFMRWLLDRGKAGGCSAVCRGQEMNPWQYPWHRASPRHTCWAYNPEDLELRFLWGNDPCGGFLGGKKLGELSSLHWPLNSHSLTLYCESKRQDADGIILFSEFLFFVFNFIEV